jgi:monoterpene epsilon-lactone hydrolase
MNGVPVVDIRPDNWTNNRKVLVYVHGGGHTMFSAHSSIPSSGLMGRATVINLRDRGMGMPAAVVLWSPSIDSSNAGDTMVTLDDADPTIGQSPTLYGYSIGAYVGDLDRKDPRGDALTRPRLKTRY